MWPPPLPLASAVSGGPRGPGPKPSVRASATTVISARCLPRSHSSWSAGSLGGSNGTPSAKCIYAFRAQPGSVKCSRSSIQRGTPFRSASTFRRSQPAPAPFLIFCQAGMSSGGSSLGGGGRTGSALVGPCPVVGLEAWPVPGATGKASSAGPRSRGGMVPGGGTSPAMFPSGAGLGGPVGAGGALAGISGFRPCAPKPDGMGAGAVLGGTRGGGEPASAVTPGGGRPNGVDGGCGGPPAGMFWKPGIGEPSGARNIPAGALGGAGISGAGLPNGPLPGAGNPGIGWPNGPPCLSPTIGPGNPGIGPPIEPPGAMPIWRVNVSCVPLGAPIEGFDPGRCGGKPGPSEGRSTEGPDGGTGCEGGGIAGGTALGWLDGPVPLCPPNGGVVDCCCFSKYLSASSPQLQQSGSCAVAVLETNPWTAPKLIRKTRMRQRLQPRLEKVCFNTTLSGNISYFAQGQLANLLLHSE